jgi:hypothetical protein
VNKEVLGKNIINPIKLISLAKDFMQQTEQSLKIEVTNPICDSEIDLENMQMGRIDVILKDFKLWKEYRDKMQQLKTS